MRSTLAIFTVLLAGLLSQAVPQGQPSGTPCSFTCPPVDQLNFAVGQKNEASDPIFCSYPVVDGEDPNDFFCKYSKTTGALVEDHDAGLCALNAVQGSGCLRRRINALPRAPHPPSPAARDVKPKVMKTRGQLKKRRAAYVGIAICAYLSS
jgi:hypothetical protein